MELKKDLGRGQESSDEGYSEQRKVEIPRAMESWSEEQKAEFAYCLLMTVSTSTLASVTQRLTPLLHRDFLAELPDEIALQILGYTQLESLVKASEVSQRWKVLCSDQTVWKKLFCNSGWFYNRKLIRSYLYSNNSLPVSPYLISPAVHSRPRFLNLATEAEDILLPESEGTDSPSRSPSPNQRGMGFSAPNSATVRRTPQATSSSENNGYSSQLGVFFAPSPRLNSPHASLLTGTPAVTNSNLFSPTRQGLPLSRTGSYSDHNSQLPGRVVYPPVVRLTPSVPNSPLVSQFRPDSMHRTTRGSPRTLDRILRPPHSENNVTPNRSPIRSPRVLNLLTRPQHFGNNLSPTFSPLTSPRGEIMNLTELFNDASMNSPMSPMSPGMGSDVASPALIMTPLPHRLDLPDEEEQSTEPLPGVGEFNPSDYYHPRFNPLTHQNSVGAPTINWKHLYRQRRQLERNWDTGSYTLRHIPAHSEGIYCIQFDELKIVSGSRDDTVKIWDIATGRWLRTYRGHHGSVLCLQYSDNLLVTGSSDSSILMWDLSTGEILRHLIDHTDSVLSLRFDDSHIVSCSKDRTVKIWNTKNGKLIRTLTGHRVAVNAVQFVKNHIVSASGDRTIKLWDLNTGECLRTFQGHARGIACLAFDGKHIVSGSSDKTIKVWDADSGTCLRTLSGHTELVRTLELGPGGRIISGSYDHTLKVWDLRTGRLVLDLNRGHESRVFKLQFSHTRIVSCSQDKNILLWDFAHDVDTTFIA